jgi:hypothetical protein
MKYHIGFFIFPLLTACVVLVPYHYCSCLPDASRSVYVFFSTEHRVSFGRFSRSLCHYVVLSWGHG